jgi:hypothetical protein
VSRSREPRDEQPTARPVDKEAERRELEAAGWRPKERAGEIVWQAPGGGSWYQQDVAIAMVRENAQMDLPLEPEDRA